MDNSVFVFGSNTSGVHGKGAALYAYKHKGAVLGVGEGRRGQSYAIPTRKFVPGTRRLVSLPLPLIQGHVTLFLQFARSSELDFLVTPIGCGYAGYSHSQIAPLFSRVSSNCVLPVQWSPFLNHAKWHSESM